jgi:drug/metabolite transporter (DMT)-like permease
LRRIHRFATLLLVYGLLLALTSAVLFGAATPAAKVLLTDLGAWQLAGLLYLGAAVGVAPWALVRRQGRPRLDAVNGARLTGAVVFGGVAGPVLLLLGLRQASAGSASLLLNFEVAMTAMLGALCFGETLGARGWIAIVGVVSAGIVLSWGTGWPSAVSSAYVVAACFCWGLDNNLTALIDGMSPSETTLWKVAIAGTTNLAVGVAMKPLVASPGTVATSLIVGALSYGASIALYISAAQQQGAIRAQSVFAAAPFVGAILSWVVLHEPVETAQVVAGALFFGAVALLASEHHSHAHGHEPLKHVHSHRHDDGHHDHVHAGLPAAVRHTHWHEHTRAEHAHPHVADLHHRHGHNVR